MMINNILMESPSPSLVAIAVPPAEDKPSPQSGPNGEVEVIAGSSTIASGDDDDHSFSSSATDKCCCVVAEEQPDVWTTSSMMQHALELVVSIGISLLFGGIYLFRTLLFSYVVHYLILFSSSFTESERWIPQHVVAAALVKGSSSRSWPPQTLIGLALFTIFMMIIHPDGFTWIFLHKIRDGVSFFLKTLTTCWSIVVHDYGTVVSTIMALATFAALFLLIFVLHRTLASRTPEHRRQHQHSRNGEKHRRKRRKHVNARGHKASQKAPSALPPQQTNFVDSMVNTDDQMSKKSGDDMSQELLPSLVEDASFESPPSTALNRSTLSVTNVESSTSEQSHSASSLTTDSLIPYSIDDQSSCSGRSTPTAAVANEKSHPTFLNNVDENSDAFNAYSLAYSRRVVNPRRGGKKLSGDVVNGAVTPPAPIPSKRWDALKPTTRSITSSRTPQRSSVPNKSRTTAYYPSREGLKTPVATEDRKSSEQTMADSVSDLEPKINFVSIDDMVTSPFSSQVEDRSLATETTMLSGEVSTLNPLSPSWTGSRPLTSDPIDPPRLNPIISPQFCFDSLQQENFQPFYGSYQCSQGMQSADRLLHHLPPHHQSSFPSTYFPQPTTTEAYGMMFSPTVDPPPSAINGTYVQHSQSPIVRENPFATNDDEEEKIEAELQVLGGQMIGSILDF